MNKKTNHQLIIEISKTTEAIVSQLKTTKFNVCQECGIKKNLKENPYCWRCYKKMSPVYKRIQINGSAKYQKTAGYKKSLEKYRESKKYQKWYRKNHPQSFKYRNKWVQKLKGFFKL